MLIKKFEGQGRAVTTVNLVRDDAGTYALKADNAAPATAPAVVPVAPYTAGGAAQSRRAQPLPVRDRRHAERRGGERRSERAAIILDTRGKHERRARLRGRRAKDCVSDAEPRAAVGINVYI